MAAYFRKKAKIKKQNLAPENNRINIIIAIVFLLGLATIYKLYELQAKNYDLYNSLASIQHQVSSELEPRRGTIYINDYETNGDDELYPFATNKEFAFLYAVPKDIDEPEDFAEKFYKIFKQKDVEEEVDALLEKEETEKKQAELDYISSWPDEERVPKEAEIMARYENYPFNPEYQELKQLKREKFIEERKEEVINNYLSKLDKPGDPYEPIEKKVDEEVLKEVYALFLSGQDQSVEVSDMEIKEGDLYIGQGDEPYKLEVPGLGFNMITHRFYPEGTIGSHLLGFVRQAEAKQEGSYGLEGYFNDELSGQFGYIKSERSADRKVIILNDREYVKPIDGKDLVLTIDRSVQFKVCEKFNRAALSYDIDGGSVIVMDPESGAIIAMCSWPLFDPNNYEEAENISVFNNPVVFSQYEPGSVFKTITMAAAIDQEKITPDTEYFDNGFLMIDGWDKPIKNSDYESVGGHGRVSMNTVLELSLNTGSIFAMEQIGPGKFAEYVENFGFGHKTNIELMGESAGNIRNIETKNIHKIYAATASFGQGITVTPLQMLNAYAAIANGGMLMKPYVVQAIIDENGNRQESMPTEIQRVISERASTLVSGMLVNVVEGGHAKAAAVDGYYVGGKTGTAQVASETGRGYGGKTIHTFVGYAPINDPKFVMLVKLDNPKGVSYSANSSAPLFGDIAEFLLNYWEVPKERK